MKRLLLFSILSICCLTISAQTITWTGAVDENYSNPNNWNLAHVPTADNDVIIPTGSTMTINVNASMKSIDVQGVSSVIINHEYFEFTNPSSFSTNSTVTWLWATLSGGGTLTNYGTINIDSANYKAMNSIVLNNEGTMNFNGTGTFRLNVSTINNQTNGIINLQAENGIIDSYLGGHKINNYGLIKRTSSTGVFNINVELHNDRGTIDVQTGELFLNNVTKLTNGIYNVSTDASLNWLNTVTCEDTLTGSLNGPINWNGSVVVPTEATFNFTGNSGINWIGGYLNGGGTLINQSEITLLSVYGITIHDNTNLNNEGNINLESTAPLQIENGFLNNQPTGIIDFRVDGANISYYNGVTHIINNYGTIKQSSTGTGSIYAILNNNDGTISVETGILSFRGIPKYLNDGSYNVSNGASLKWETQIVPSGILTGVLDGEISWLERVSLPDDNTATFNFTGNTGVNWKGGRLDGGGTLINKSEITMLTVYSISIHDNTKLNNEGNFNIESSTTLSIEDGIFNNQSSGVIDFRVDGSISYYIGSVHILNNMGLLKKSGGTGASTIRSTTTNSGIIDAQSGTLDFVDYGGPLINTQDGIIMGIATITIPGPAKFTNDGTFAPGGSPGTLTVIGGFNSSSTSELQIEIYGPTQGTDYDLLAVQGNAIMVMNL